MKNTPLYKKAVFQAARRAMLENELFLRKFAETYVADNYNEEKLQELVFLLENILDMDLFEIVMGQKPAEAFADKYNVEILKDIEIFAKGFKDFVKEER